MPDREKVIKGLECLADVHDENCVGCGYIGIGIYPVCVREVAKDALDLLKEQEAVKPFMQISEHTGRKWLTCGACENLIASEKESWEEINFCQKCGRPILWEGR